MRWEQFRKKKLQEYASAEIDQWIRPITDTINSSEDFVTLSSCAGRIAVMDMPEFGDKKGSVFLGKWHSPPPFQEVVRVISAGRGEVWFMMNPPIVHVACRDPGMAFRLLDVCKRAGFRRAGVISARKNVVEIAGQERVEFLVARNGEIIADERVLMENFRESVDKLKKSRERFRRFEEEFRSAFLSR
ncbi:MAG: hypothetical protein GXO67_04930 [Archaeoglobi archaeon]|nr:hypothetical protein [Archaeoglobi archaeon]